jgi:hypothetical protein
MAAAGCDPRAGAGSALREDDNMDDLSRWEVHGSADMVAVALTCCFDDPMSKGSTRASRSSDSVADNTTSNRGDRHQVAMSPLRQGGITTR